MGMGGNKMRNCIRCERKKFILSLLGILSTICLMACGGKDSLDGKWELTRIETAGGTVTEEDDLITSECYEIDGNTAQFTSYTEGHTKMSFELDVEKISEDNYKFIMKGKNDNKIDFTKGKLEGKYLKCTTCVGEDDVVFMYEKQ